MEHVPERREAPSEDVAPQERQLPARKVERMAQETKGLVEDLTSWVELKLRLTQIEVEERVEAKFNEAVVGVIVGLIAVLAVVFALVSLALGVGAWLGHPAWGFLVVTVLLLLVTGALRAAQPHLVKVGEKRQKNNDKDRSTDGALL